MLDVEEMQVMRMCLSHSFKERHFKTSMLGFCTLDQRRQLLVITDENKTLTAFDHRDEGEGFSNLASLVDKDMLEGQPTELRLCRSRTSTDNYGDSLESLQV